MLTAAGPALLHTIGYVTGATLYAMLLAMVLRAPASDRLMVVTGALGLVWNVGELLAGGIVETPLGAAAPWLQAIAYNLVRALMLEAAWTHGAQLERLSFKGTVDTLRQWTPLFAPSMFAFKRAREELLRIIAADQVPDRPNRSEPRARKRRPKNYQLLTKPRREMSWHTPATSNESA